MLLFLFGFNPNIRHGVRLIIFGSSPKLKSPPIILLLRRTENRLNDRKNSERSLDHRH